MAAAEPELLPAELLDVEAVGYGHQVEWWFKCDRLELSC